MKLKIKLDSLDGLDEATKALYIEKDGAFHLDLDGYEDPAALLRAKQHEKDARKKAEDDLRTLREEFTTFKSEVEAERDDKNRKKGNVAELDASWQAKYDKLKADHAKDIEKLNGKIKTLLVDNVATTLAAELSDSPELLSDLIRKRLTVEDGANGPETRVLDAGGNLSALTVDELREEFKGNKKYAAVIRGSQSSGGGSGGGGNGGGATKAFKDMSEKERTDFAKSNPAEYQRQFDAYRKETGARSY
jgi:hypothetical protein